MKSPVAITLIIVGGLLVAAPILSDYLHRAQAVAALEKAGVTSVNLSPTLSDNYRFGCWFTGTAMVAAAIISARRSDTKPEA